MLDMLSILDIYYILIYTRFLAKSQVGKVNKMKIIVVRSPAKVAWHVVCNGNVLDVCSTKKVAYASKHEYEKLLGVHLNG